MRMIGKKRDKTPKYMYDQLSEGFDCYSQSLDTPFAVQEGDIIGVCVVNPDGSMRRLYIVK